MAGTGSNQYQTKPGGGSPPARRAETQATAAAVQDIDVETVAFAFSPDRCPPFDISPEQDLYDYLAGKGDSVWQGETPQEFSMFTGQGDLAVGALITTVVDGVQRGAIPPVPNDISVAVREGVRRIEKAGHGEVTDTAVREALYGELEARLKDNGWDFELEALT